MASEHLEVSPWLVLICEFGEGRLPIGRSFVEVAMFTRGDHTSAFKHEEVVVIFNEYIPLVTTEAVPVWSYQDDIRSFLSNLFYHVFPLFIYIFLK